MSKPKRRQRKQNFIDGHVQGALLRRIVFHWVAFFVVAALSIILLQLPCSLRSCLTRFDSAIALSGQLHEFVATYDSLAKEIRSDAHSAQTTSGLSWQTNSIRQPSKLRSSRKRTRPSRTRSILQPAYSQSPADTSLLYPFSLPTIVETDV